MATGHLPPNKSVVCLGPAVVPFYPFLGEGSPTEIDYRKNGYPILAFFLEDLVDTRQQQWKGQRFEDGEPEKNKKQHGRLCLPIPFPGFLVGVSEPFGWEPPKADQFQWRPVNSSTFGGEIQ